MSVGWMGIWQVGEYFSHTVYRLFFAILWSKRDTFGSLRCVLLYLEDVVCHEVNFKKPK